MLPYGDIINMMGVDITLQSIDYYTHTLYHSISPSLVECNGGVNTNIIRSKIPAKHSTLISAIHWGVTIGSCCTTPMKYYVGT